MNTASQQPNPQEIPNPRNQAQQPPRPRSTVGEIVMAVFVGATVVIYIVLTCVSVRTMHVDQRAWIKPEIGGGNFIPNKVITAKVGYRNIGKTPALSIEGIMRLEIIDPQQSPTFTYPEPREVFNVKVLYPNELESIEVPAVEESPNGKPIGILQTPDLMKEMDTGQVAVVLYGSWTYLDDFNDAHWGRFCSFNWKSPGIPGATIVPSPRAMKACYLYSAAGDGAPPKQ